MKKVFLILIMAVNIFAQIPANISNVKVASHAGHYVAIGTKRDV